MNKIITILFLSSLFLLIAGCEGLWFAFDIQEPFDLADEAVNGDIEAERYILKLPLIEQHRFYRYCVNTMRPPTSRCEDIFASNGCNIMPIIYQALLIEQDKFMQKHYLSLIEELIVSYNYCPDVEMSDFIKHVAESIRSYYPRMANSIGSLLETPCQNVPQSKNFPRRDPSRHYSKTQVPSYHATNILPCLFGYARYFSLLPG